MELVISPPIRDKICHSQYLWICINIHVTFVHTEYHRRGQNTCGCLSSCKYTLLFLLILNTHLTTQLHDFLPTFASFYKRIIVMKKLTLSHYKPGQVVGIHEGGKAVSSNHRSPYLAHASLHIIFPTGAYRIGFSGET